MSAFKTVYQPLDGKRIEVNYRSAINRLCVAQTKLWFARAQTEAINRSRKIFQDANLRGLIRERRAYAQSATWCMLQAVVLLRKGVFIT